MDRPVTLSGPEQAPARGGAPDSLVIFLHGYGSNGDDLIALAKPFSQVLPGAHFLSPHAIEPCPGAPGGHQWFPLSTLSREERDEGVTKAGPVVSAYVEAQLARFGLAPERCVLVGFSQGTMLALHVGLRFRPQLAGVLGYSGALARIGMLMDEIRTRPPVQLVHGDQDPVVPAWMMFESLGALEALRVPVSWHISRNTPHSIAPDGLEVGARFLQRLLG